MDRYCGYVDFKDGTQEMIDTDYFICYGTDILTQGYMKRLPKWIYFRKNEGMRLIDGKSIKYFQIEFVKEN